MMRDLLVKRADSRAADPPWCDFAMFFRRSLRWLRRRALDGAGLCEGARVVLDFRRSMLVALRRRKSSSQSRSVCEIQVAK